ncbi:MAG: hypothetical protein KDB68_08160 [Planctomycetes bacterium]|nr:hypothetical protein [Planctomycetota bacterium]
MSANDPNGSLFCWLGLIGNAIVAIGILTYLLAPVVGISLPISPLMVPGALVFCILCWLLSAAVYGRNSKKVDSDAMGVALGLALLVPVGLDLLLTIAAVMLAPMG